MSLKLLKNEFDIRFFHWQLAEARREVQEGLRFLRTLKNIDAKQIVEIFDSLDNKKQEKLAIALVKRSDPYTLKLVGQSLTNEEQDLYEWFYEQRISREKVIERITDSRDATNTISLKALRYLLIEALKQRFESPCHTDKLGIYYQSEIGSWTVQTWVETGKRKLTYLHFINAKESKLIELLPGVGMSVGVWLGFGSRVTCWVDLTEEEAPQIAQALATLCSHFMDALPDLLTDLDSMLIEAIQSLQRKKKWFDRRNHTL